MCGTWPASSTTCSGQPSRALAGLGEAERDEAVVQAQTQRRRDLDAVEVGTGSCRSSISRRIVRLTCGTRARASGRRRTRRTTPGRARARGRRRQNAQRSKRSRCASRAQREPDRPVTAGRAASVRPTPGAVDHEPLEPLAVLGREAGGEAAAERVRDERGRSSQVSSSSAAEPAANVASSRPTAPTRRGRAGRGRRPGGAGRAPATTGAHTRGEIDPRGGGPSDRLRPWRTASRRRRGRAAARSPAARPASACAAWVGRVVGELGLCSRSPDMARR